MAQITDSEFNDLSALLLEVSGISIPISKKYLFNSRLDKRLTETKSKDYQAYYNFLRSGNKSEIEIFINAMTTNLSYFFREPHHFKTLTTNFKAANTKNFKVASLGCSTGEEPISIAITLLEAGAAPEHFDIVAGDIDTGVIAECKSGIYSNDKMQHVPPNLLAKYFTKQLNGYKVNQNILSRINYTQLNLVKNPLPFPKNSFDQIFCRNALIYFPPATQKDVVSRLATLLKPKSFLCLGHAELLTDASTDLIFLNQSTYQKKSWA